MRSFKGRIGMADDAWKVGYDSDMMVLKDDGDEDEVREYGR